MDVKKRIIKTTINKAQKQVQMTVDEDKNVPDSKIDIEKIIVAKSYIKIQESEGMVDRLRINGQLEGEILYSGTDGNSRIATMQFSLEFEEYFHVEHLLPTDRITLLPEVEDLNITLINSRKIGIRAILNFTIFVVNSDEVEIISDSTGEGIQLLHKNISMTQLLVDKKDILRLHEEVVLPANRSNIYEALWNYVEIYNLESKIYDQKIQIQGLLHVFLLYLGEEEHVPMQYTEWEIPIRTELECYECKEGMIGNVGYRLIQRNIEIRPDIDGEMRNVQIEIGLEMDLKIYEEVELRLLEDIYHWKKELVPSYETFSYEQLVAKNTAIMKINQKIQLNQKRGKILQLLSIDGQCKIDEMEKEEKGIRVEGIFEGTILYLTSEDSIPINSMPVLLPFSYLIEAKEMKMTDHYHIHADINQLNAVFLDGDEIEIKAEIVFDLIVLSEKVDDIIIKVVEKELDLAKLQQTPGIIGYRVKKGDSLWKIAKKYYTTISSIQRLNPEIEDEVKEGELLIIMKEIEEALDCMSYKEISCK